MSDGALYRLMAWLSPAYPVGAFSYSSGIEWAVEACDITDATTFQRWLTADSATRRSSSMPNGPRQATTNAR
jgi:urease accessory protein UreF